MIVTERPPIGIKRIIGGAVDHVRGEAIAWVTGDRFASWTDAPKSVRLPSRPTAKSISEAEAGGYRPRVLVVGEEKGLLRGIVVSMPVFGDVFLARDVTTASSTLKVLSEKREPIDFVVLDTQITEGGRGWLDIAETANRYSAKGIVLFGDVTPSLRQRRELGIRRVVDGHRDGRQLRAILTNTVKKVFPRAS